MDSDGQVSEQDPLVVLIFFVVVVLDWFVVPVFVVCVPVVRAAGSVESLVNDEIVVMGELNTIKATSYAFGL